MDEWSKIVKKQRKRFAKRKREIRKEVHSEFLSLVEERIRSFKEYIGRWCVGPEEDGEEEEAENGERVQGARKE